MFYEFDQLENAPLIVDAVYEGGWEAKNLADDPLPKLFKNVGNGVGAAGGFRKSGTGYQNGYCVLYTTGSVPDWPDQIDLRNGMFTYYGDNRKAGRLLSNPKGNRLLEHSFASIHASKEARASVLPYLVFEKHPTERSERSVRFRGLAVPGFDGLSSSEDLVAVWRSNGDKRFQNYRAIFSILDVGVVSKEWLNDPSNENLMPDLWRHWLSTGEAKRLQAIPTIEIRTKDEQTPVQPDEQKLIQMIHRHFQGRYSDFEPFAAHIFTLIHPSAVIDEVTRATVDGGRDAIGRLPVGFVNDPVYLDFALEAKCYAPPVLGESGTSAGVGDTKRLISRLKHRQFGVFVTTSFVAPQAYKEIREDGHPVIIICGADIVSILRNCGFGNEAALKQLLSGY